MTNDASEKARMGRPRTFADDDVFVATARTLGRIGYRALTLDAIAEDLPCTGQALYKRFGSRRALLLAYVRWSNAQTEIRYREAEASARSPLAALEFRIGIPPEDRPDEAHDPATTAHILTFRFETIDDPEFGPLWQERDAVIEQSITRMIEAARQAGEIVADADTARLGRALHLALFGATALSPLRPQPVGDAFTDLVETVLAPYRTPG